MKSEKFLNVKQISPKFPMGIGWAGQKIHSITKLLSHLIWDLFYIMLSMTNKNTLAESRGGVLSSTGSRFLLKNQF